MSVGNEPAPIFNGTLTQGGANPYAHNCVPPPVLETMGSPAKFVGREMSSGLAASISVATNPADSVASYRQPDLVRYLLNVAAVVVIVQSCKNK